MKAKKPFKKALFIFRRDLRLEDNTGLSYALENADEVIPCFIFTPEQIDHNAYRSDHCLQFMLESLEDLAGAVKAKGGRLHFFHDRPENVVAKCIEELHVDAVVVNRDYTPYSSKRDRKIDDVCLRLGASLHSFDDVLLNPPEQTLKGDGKPYSIFTPYYRNASRLAVRLPVANRHANYCAGPISFAEGNSLYHKILPKRLLKPSGGRDAALEILTGLKKFSDYPVSRNTPAIEGTTRLSAHLKFTTISPREAYWAVTKQLGAASELIRSLYWRDFFTSIAFYYPEVFASAFHAKYNRLEWSHDEGVFRRWCEGQTGFPIVDAGMRELLHTGFMHNRVRMVVASFLVKDLHIDWRWGEKYFARMLIDYDPAVNNGNWQWAASTGCDAQPYFRIFNPWLQGLKFDPDCVYIKRWLPELASLPPATIHKWHMEKYRPACPAYPAPIADHATEAKAALAAYKRC